MLDIHEKYCKPYGRKIMALGTSLGANRLGYMLGEEGESSVLDAAVCCSAPMKLWNAFEYVEKTYTGVYDKALGGYLAQVYLNHIDVLGPHFKKEHGIDLKQTIDDMSPITLGKVEDRLTSQLAGFKDKDDLFNRASCCHQIPGIKTPTLFFNSLDDPLIPPPVIDFESINANPSCVLATSNYGGHLGHYESLLSED